jgi:hypothetical protein
VCGGDSALCKLQQLRNGWVGVGGADLSDQIRLEESCGIIQP